MKATITKVQHYKMCNTKNDQTKDNLESNSFLFYTESK